MIATTDDRLYIRGGEGQLYVNANPVSIKKDSITGDQHLRFPKICANFNKEVNLKSLSNFIEQFRHIVNKEFNRIQGFKDFYFILKEDLFHKVVDEHHEKNKAMIINQFRICDVNIKEGKQDQQYDIMTDNTTYYWINLLRKTEDEIQNRRES